MFLVDVVLVEAHVYGMCMMPLVCHLHTSLFKYINVVRYLQVSEVLCTTVAEALAMGKWVVCARHSSNEFFFQFPNCLPFDGEEDFAACVSWALRHDPEDLTPALRCLLLPFLRLCNETHTHTHRETYYLSLRLRNETHTHTHTQKLITLPSASATQRTHTHTHQHTQVHSN